MMNASVWEYEKHGWIKDDGEPVKYHQYKSNILHLHNAVKDFENAGVRVQFWWVDKDNRALRVAREAIDNRVTLRDEGVYLGEAMGIPLEQQLYKIARIAELNRKLDVVDNTGAANEEINDKPTAEKNTHEEKMEGKDERNNTGITIVEMDVVDDSETIGYLETPDY